MVLAKFYMDEKRKLVSLNIKGHAGQSKQGRDLVCASASILAYTLAQNVKGAQVRGILKCKPTLNLREGNAIIACRSRDDESYAEMCHAFVVIQAGYQLLAHNYPQYVAVETFGEDTGKDI